MKKLSPKQRELLARAAAGEDRQLPEEMHYPGRSFIDLAITALSGRPDVPMFMPARRWYVPPGLLVPSGSVEHQAARALAAKGLLKPGTVPPSAELPYGQGGYLVTKKGWKFLVG